MMQMAMVLQVKQIMFLILLIEKWKWEGLDGKQILPHY